MTKKEMSGIRSQSKESIEAKLAELRAELAKERSIVASGTRPENPGKIRKVRRSIAKHLTVLREREVKEG